MFAIIKELINIFFAKFMKNCIGNKVINNESGEKIQFPCGNNILWNNVNAKLKFIDINTNIINKMSAAIPA